MPYLTPLGAWALSVGTAIVWGSFVFTTNLYLSEAGPLGSALGMFVGMVIMLFISRNYHYLINYYPSAGGVYGYVKKIFGYDRAFLSFWYVGLAYLAMLWANATSLPLFARNFLGDTFRVGYLYTVFDYEVYLGEVLLTMAFIGFENISHSAREFKFSHKKTFNVLTVSVVTTTLLYIFVILLSISAIPSQYSGWPDYINRLAEQGGGLKVLPAFYAAHYYLGDTGMYLLAAALLSLVITSLIGNTVALSRLFYRGEAGAAAYEMGEADFINSKKQDYVVRVSRKNSVVLILIMFSMGMFFTNYAIVQRRTEETEAELGHVQKLAYRDAMTGVKSKQAYVDEVSRLDELIAAGTIKEFAMAVCDVNGLKHINDTYGHKAGDEYICSASDLICVNFKHSPVFRTGGDEFVAILEKQGFERRHASVEAFNRQVEANVKEEGKVVVSVGLSEFVPGQDKNVHDVFERADALMYKRKMQLKAMGAKTRA